MLFFCSPGYTYERLDGSVRGDERYLAVKNFNHNEDTFVFLLSTKAGKLEQMHFLPAYFLFCFNLSFYIQVFADAN